jgi:hypothetical protein
VTSLVKKEEDLVEHQVAQLAKSIQQLQQRITDIDLQTIPSTPQDVRDQREATSRSIVDRIIALALECQKRRSRSVQTYE